MLDNSEWNWCFLLLCYILLTPTCSSEQHEGYALLHIHCNICWPNTSQSYVTRRLPVLLNKPFLATKCLLSFASVGWVHLNNATFPCFFVSWQHPVVPRTRKVCCYLPSILDGNTGLFISPSGIPELDCATTKTDTAERSISIGRESLQVFFLY